VGQIDGERHMRKKEGYGRGTRVRFRDRMKKERESERDIERIQDGDGREI
jgi:hypothetical protein